MRFSVLRGYLILKFPGGEKFRTRKRSIKKGVYYKVNMKKTTKTNKKGATNE
jgi:hypothetical protein